LPQSAATRKKQMRWVDHDSYFGPDRRRPRRGFRLLDRRRHDCAGEPPSLHNAMRHLRLRVIEATGSSAAQFADRVNATALLAQMQNEPEASFELSSLGESITRHMGEDLRLIIYNKLDRAQAVLRAA
jgi:hypothetical protein